MRTLRQWRNGGGVSQYAIRRCAECPLPILPWQHRTVLLGSGRRFHLPGCYLKRNLREVCQTCKDWGNHGARRHCTDAFHRRGA